MLPNFLNLKLSATGSVDGRDARGMVPTEAGGGDRVSGTKYSRGIKKKPRQGSPAAPIAPVAPVAPVAPAAQQERAAAPQKKRVPLLRLAMDNGFVKRTVTPEQLSGLGEVLAESGQRDVSRIEWTPSNSCPFREVRTPNPIRREVEITLNEILELDMEKYNNSCSMLRVNEEGFGLYLEGESEYHPDMVASLKGVKKADSNETWNGEGLAKTMRSSTQVNDPAGGGAEGFVLQMAEWQKSGLYCDAEIVFSKNEDINVVAEVHNQILIHKSSTHAVQFSARWADSTKAEERVVVDLSEMRQIEGADLEQAIDTFLACLYDTNGIISPVATTAEILLQVVTWLHFLDMYADIRFVAPLLGNTEDMIYIAKSLQAFDYTIIDTPSFKQIQAAKLRIEVIAILEYAGGIVEENRDISVTEVHIGKIFGDEFTLSLCLGETARLRILLMLPSYALIKSYLGLIDFRLVANSELWHPDRMVRALLLERMKLVTHRNAGGAIVPVQVLQPPKRSERARIVGTICNAISVKTSLSTGVFINNAVVVPLNVNVFTWKRYGVDPVVLNSWTSPESGTAGPNYAIIQYPPLSYNMNGRGEPRMPAFNIQACLLAPEGNATWSRPPWLENVDYDIASTYTKLCDHELPVWVYAALAARLEGAEMPSYPTPDPNQLFFEDRWVFDMSNRYNFTSAPYTFETPSMWKRRASSSERRQQHSLLPQNSIYQNQPGWKHMTEPKLDVDTDVLVDVSVLQRFVYKHHLDPNMRVVGGVDLVGHAVQFKDSPKRMQSCARYKLDTPDEYNRTPFPF